MEILNIIDLKQFGLSGIIIALLIWHIIELRKDIRSEREYTRQLNQKDQEAKLRYLETLKSLEQAIELLRGSLR